MAAFPQGKQLMSRLCVSFLLKISPPLKTDLIAYVKDSAGTESLQTDMIVENRTLNKIFYNLISSKGMLLPDVQISFQHIYLYIYARYLCLTFDERINFFSRLYNYTIMPVASGWKNDLLYMQRNRRVCVSYHWPRGFLLRALPMSVDAPGGTKLANISKGSPLCNDNVGQHTSLSRVDSCVRSLVYVSYLPVQPASCGAKISAPRKIKFPPRAICCI